MITGTIALVVISLLVPVLVIMCSSGVIARNPLAGIRIPALLASDDAWKTGHRAAILPTLLAAIATVALAFLSFTIPALSEWGLLLAGAPILIGLIWAAIRANIASQRDSTPEEPAPQTRS